MFKSFFFKKPKKSNLPQQEFKNILVWSSMGIGNMVNFLPMLRALRERYPLAKITLLSWSDPSVFELVEKNIYSEIKFINKKSKISLILNFIFLLFNTYDLFIVKWHRNIWIARFIKACKNSYVVGHISSAGHKCDYDDLIDHKVKLIHEKSDKYQYLNLINDLLIKKADYEEYLTISPNATSKITKLFHENNLTEEDFLIGFHLDVGAAQPYKQIGFEKWLDIINGIQKEAPDAKFIFLGLKDDIVANKIINEIANDIKIYSFLGKLNILETTACISKLRLIVGVDSSLKTIASALKVKSVVPYGCTDPSRSAPPESEIVVVRPEPEQSPCEVFGPIDPNKCSHQSCINRISANAIVSATMNIVNNY
mgnify:CR=1 FL=1